MGSELRPTLWRTARALDNADRLNLMRLVVEAKGKKGVVELAAEANLPVPTASVYLRALNARGLISVVRSGPYVYYGTSPDRSLPVAVRIQKYFVGMSMTTWRSGDWASTLLPMLRAYANPRREAMVRVLGEGKSLRYAEYKKLSGLCETSFLRHLEILVTGGVVMRDSLGTYLLTQPPAGSLSAVFLDAACR